MAEPPKKSRTLLYVGLGCLAVCVLGCLVAFGVMYMGAKGVVDGVSEALGPEPFKRAAIIGHLSSFRQACAADPSGAQGQAQAAALLYPGAAAMLAPQVCTTTDGAVAAFSDPTRSPATPLAGSPDEARATALGVAASSCAVFTSGAAKVIVCEAAPGNPQIIYFENLNTL